MRGKLRLHGNSQQLEIKKLKLRVDIQSSLFLDSNIKMEFDYQDFDFNGSFGIRTALNEV
jgi:hypothetical protein